MPIRVAVVDPLPVFVEGLTAILSSEGVEPETPEDLIAWAAGDAPSAILLSLLSAREWTLLAEIHRLRPDVSVVALVETPGPETSLRACCRCDRRAAPCCIAVLGAIRLPGRRGRTQPAAGRSDAHSGREPAPYSQRSAVRPRNRLAAPTDRRDQRVAPR